MMNKKILVLVLIGLAALSLSGCASVPNTSAQDGTWERLRACDATMGNVQVKANGSWRIVGAQSDVGEAS